MASLSTPPNLTAQSYNPKPSLSSYQLLALTLGVSLAAHIVLVLIPYGESKKPPTLEKEDPITVTQKPPAPRVDSQATKTVPGNKLVKSSTKATKTTTANRSTTSLKRTTSVTGTARAVSRSSTSSQSSGTATTTTSTTTVGAAASATTTTKPASQATTATTTLPSFTPASGPTLSAATSITRNPNPTIVAEFIKNLTELRAGFPNYPGAVFQCAGLTFCYTAPANLEKVAAYLSREFQARNYDLTLDLDESDRKVYKLAKDGKSQVLSIIANGANTVYLFADTPYSAQEVQQAAKTFGEYQQILGQLLPDQGTADAVLVKPENFENPKLFYSNWAETETTSTPEPHSLADRQFALLAGKAPNQVLQEGLEANLKSQNFQVVAQPFGYGGGLLYEVTKDNLKFYLNLVPAKNREGTILVTWLNSPVGDRVQKNERFLVVR